ncbi:MAG: zinc ABC transporter substrate-binding protein [Neisseriaceae bacterium]|nr:zinc ABC transporter substrate-binding protein [Neisseriaceae bacterium]MBP6863565.1 zinc ABC transporter substrate-binding protein [Neisseriaceae bacterium]
MKTNRLSIYAALVAGLSMSGLAQAAPMPVVSSFSILGDVAKQVGGERVAITNLVGPDQDAHVYQLTPKDIRTLGQAKLVLLNGLGFESARLTRVVKQGSAPYAMVTKGIKALAADEHDDHDHGHGEPGHTHGGLDPHVWHDPVLMQAYAANVAKALTYADPQGKAYYQQRLTAYQNRLKELNLWAAAQFKPIPVAQRKVLTAHGAFAYLGKRYQIQFVAPQGVSTESEASARTVAAIIRQVKQDHIKAVFVENIKDKRLIERLSQETGVKVQGALYSDALSGPKGPAATYIDLIRHNVGLLAKGLK